MVADLVLENAAEGIWLVDASARTTFVNRRIADLLGYSEEEMIGRPLFDFLSRDRWVLAERNLQQRARGIEDRLEVQLVRKDGSRVWVLGSASPVFDRNGNYAGALAVLGDLSPQKEREQQLEAQVTELRARLASYIAERAPDRSAPRPESMRAYPEPFRTAIVIGVYGTFLGLTAMTTIGAVAARWLGTPSNEDGF